VTVQALRNGEPDVLADLLASHGREIQGVAFLILRDRSAAEDVLMDTLVTALERGATLRDPSALRPWLLRIATNHALGARRRTGRVSLMAVVPDVATPAPDTADRVALLDELARLPIRTRTAIVLHYFADLPVADVAAAMGTSTNTAKTQLRQGLGRLRASLADTRTLAPIAEVAHG
jgi:RNA polymerase sigma factor (sigma-70 family)